MFRSKPTRGLQDIGEHLKAPAGAVGFGWVTKWLAALDLSASLGLTFGPFVATFFPLPLVILNPDMSLSSKVLAFVLPLALHTFVGHFVEPVIMVCVQVFSIVALFGAAALFGH